MWSPDSRQIAFVSSTAGPEQDANGDPMVITRYLYKQQNGVENMPKSYVVREAATCPPRRGPLRGR